MPASRANGNPRAVRTAKSHLKVGMRVRAFALFTILLCASTSGARSSHEQLPPLEEVRALLDTGDGAAAWKAARRVLDERPKDAEARLLAGSALLKLGRLEKAEKELEHALKLDPSLPGVHGRLGDLAMAQAKEVLDAEYQPVMPPRRSSSSGLPRPVSRRSSSARPRTLTVSVAVPLRFALRSRRPRRR